MSGHGHAPSQRQVSACARTPQPPYTPTVPRATHLPLLLTPRSTLPPTPAALPNQGSYLLLHPDAAVGLAMGVLRVLRGAAAVTAPWCQWPSVLLHCGRLGGAKNKLPGPALRPADPRDSRSAARRQGQGQEQPRGMWRARRGSGKNVILQGTQSHPLPVPTQCLGLMDSWGAQEL